MSEATPPLDSTTLTTRPVGSVAPLRSVIGSRLPLAHQRGHVARKLAKLHAYARSRASHPSAK